VAGKESYAMHTLETLLDLADSYATITADPATLTKARAALQSALQEVLAERDRKSDAIQKLWAERDQLRAEVERLKAQPDKVAVLQAIARGWCSTKNSSKIMDCNLALAIQEEVMALLASGAAPNVYTNQQNLDTSQERVQKSAEIEHKETK
jgi:chromosome segregation ATPase